mgnify:CR=1 FL=1
MDMARRTSKHRPAQGRKLTDLRVAAGLSQAELAKLVGTHPSNVGFWELSDKPPRSDMLPSLAKALGVKIEDILSENGSKLKSVKAGPKGKLKTLFDEVSDLPRRQQEKIIEFVSAFVKQYKQGNA